MDYCSLVTLKRCGGRCIVAVCCGIAAGLWGCRIYWNHFSVVIVLMLAWLWKNCRSWIDVCFVVVLLFWLWKWFLYVFFYSGFNCCCVCDIAVEVVAVINVVRRLRLCYCCCGGGSAVAVVVVVWSLWYNHWCDFCSGCVVVLLIVFTK